MRKLKFIRAWRKLGKTNALYEIRFSDGHTWCVRENSDRPTIYWFVGIFSWTVFPSMEPINYENLPPSVKKAITDIRRDNNGLARS